MKMSWGSAGIVPHIFNLFSLVVNNKSTICHEIIHQILE